MPRARHVQPNGVANIVFLIAGLSLTIHAAHTTGNHVIKRVDAIAVDA